MMRSKLLSLICLSLLCLPAYAKLYKWVDEHGETHYGSSIPPEYAQKSNTELTTTGYTKTKNEAALTKEEIAKIEAEKNRKIEAARKKQQQAEQDQRLLNTYANSDVIIMTRDGKIRGLESRIRTARTNITKLQEGLALKQPRIDKLKQTNRPIPKDITHYIKTTERSIEENELAIQEYRQQQRQIRHDFNQKLRRYKEIKHSKHRR